MGDEFVHLDAGVLIALFDSADSHHGSIKRELKQLESDGVEFQLSAIAFTEAMVVPKRIGGRIENIVRKQYAKLFPLGAKPIDEECADRAAGLRAEHAWLRTSDALIVSCAQMAGASLVLTTDKRLARLPDVQYVGA